MPLSRENMRIYIKKYKEDIKQQAIMLLGGHCVKCGSTDYLEIDHIDPSKKSFTLARNWTRARHLTEEELSKCQLLCAKCHMEKTIRERQKKISCGTATSYRHGCRCTECKGAWNNYMKEKRSN